MHGINLHKGREMAEKNRANPQKKKIRAKRNDQPKPGKNTVDRKECPKQSAK